MGSSFTQAQLDALEEALSQGVRVVRYSDKTVEYKSTAEMLQIRDIMRDALGVTSGRTKRIYSEFDKGLCD